MDEKMVSLRINDIPVTVPEGSTVLEAARSAGFNIPSLCFLKDINEIGACRICVVEVKGAKSLVASCVYPVAEGMEVYTNTERVLQVRPLPPVHRRVPQDPGGGRHRPQRPGLPHPHRLCLRPGSGRGGLCLLRPVHRGLPHRRPLREG